VSVARSHPSCPEAIARPLNAEEWAQFARIAGDARSHAPAHIWSDGARGKRASELHIEILDPHGAVHTGDLSRRAGQLVTSMAPYRWEWFGLAVPWPFNKAAPWPSLRLPNFPPGHSNTIQLHQGLFWRDGSPIYTQMLWRDGDRRERWSVHGLGNPAAAGEWAEARSLLKAAQRAVDRGGRPRLENEDDPQWLPLTEQAIAYKRDHPRYTWQQVAVHFGIPYATLKRWRAAYAKLGTSRGENEPL
jgi:hypothetical protein